MRDMILVTGFKPWGKFRTNPSGIIAKNLDGLRLGSEAMMGVELDVSYRRVRKTLPRLIEDLSPKLVINLGLAPGTPGIRVERVAINIVDAGKDVDGVELRDTEIVQGGPAAYFSTLPTRKIVEALRGDGIPSHLSYTAGTFLCNYTMYLSLHTVKTLGVDAKAGFLHVPLTPEMAVDGKAPSMPLGMIEKAVKIAIETSLKH